MDICRSVPERCANFQAALTMFQYFVSLVPTIYVDSSGEAMITNQYAATMYSRNLEAPGAKPGFPGVFIKYDIQPILVRISPKRKSFVHFFTRVIGIVGGLFTCTGLYSEVSLQLSLVLI